MFHPDLALAEYRALNRASDQLVLQNKVSETTPLLRRLLAMEKKALRYGYRLTVLCDSFLREPDEEICWIERVVIPFRPCERAGV